MHSCDILTTTHIYLEGDKISFSIGPVSTSLDDVHSVQDYNVITSVSHFSICTLRTILNLLPYIQFYL